MRLQNQMWSARSLAAYATSSSSSSSSASDPTTSPTNTISKSTAIEEEWRHAGEVQSRAAHIQQQANLRSPVRADIPIAQGVVRSSPVHRAGREWRVNLAQRSRTGPLVVLTVLVAAGYFADAALDLRRDLVLEGREVAAIATVTGTSQHFSRCGSWCTTVTYAYAVGGASFESSHAVPDRLRAALRTGGMLSIAYDPLDPCAPNRWPRSSTTRVARCSGLPSCRSPC